jgi:hypothetical protein
MSTLAEAERRADALSAVVRDKRRPGRSHHATQRVLPMKPKKQNIEPQSVAGCSAVLRDLEAKRDELQAACEELAAARKAAAYVAHTGGSHELVNVMRAIRANAADLESISEAIHEAGNRVLIAKGHEADLANQANVAEILRLAAAFRTCGNELDVAARALGRASTLDIQPSTNAANVRR